MNDLISRKAAINGKIAIQRANGVEIYSDEAVPVKYLKALPSAQPEHKKGKWIKTPEFRGDDVSSFIDNHWSCSECKKEAETNSWGFYILSNFCPNCVADMRGE